ncbi:MAG: heavy-metal-associated domain-containing protein [Phycisphaerales bacterium]|nr:heavy-metal-associated domain-containing protein [Planctomycetota bacterium]MCH8509121.1 heavy-metal-associated domain-containing protein [Phycisphaerales bacterium]
METSTFTVTGMHCAGCEAKIHDAVAGLPGVTAVQPHAASDTLTVESDAPIDREILAAAVAGAGDYELGDPIAAPPPEQGVVGRDMAGGEGGAASTTGAKGYPALAILIGYILAASVLADLPRPGLESVMSNFMGGFFLAFSFFKFLDIRGFARGFARYDIVAERWKPWGYIYPFVELSLGLAYLTIAHGSTAMLATHFITMIVMGVGAIGVIRSMIRKDRVKCACLGTVIDLPLGTVTLIEDLGMALMAAAMIALHFSG